jgi:hypothetical protein
MLQDGMVPEKQIKYYMKNPRELEEDTRKGLYFSFASLAVAGGFL